MELCGLKYIVALPQPYNGPRKEFRRGIDLSRTIRTNSKWISDTMRLVKNLVTEEFERTDLSGFNAFTSRISDPEQDEEGGESTTMMMMTVTVTLCFIDPGG